MVSRLLEVNMYQPKHFSETDSSKIRKLVEQNGFVTVLSFPKNEKPFINHLPISFSTLEGQENIIIGHMARKNPQWLHFKSNPDCTLIITGPHSYITPRWYRSGRDVPTWNYAVVHLHGKIELVETFDGQVEILKQLSATYEKPSTTPWEFELPDDLLNESALNSAIISFKFYTEKIDAKFKLSQNRSHEDRQGVIEGLLERTDDRSQLVRKMMIENEGGK